MNAKRSTSPRKRRGRPPAGESAAQRAKLLAVALEEFLRLGFAGADIDAIARRSGVARATIYRQYRAKENLFRAAIETRTRYLTADLRAITNRKASPKRTLSAVIERIFVAFTGDLLSMTRLAIAEAARFPDLCSSVWEEETRDILAPVIEYLRLLRASGLIDIADERSAGYHLMNMASGGVRFLLNDPPASPALRQQWVSNVLQMAVPMLRLKESS
jgi:TetR/AcrR family transcriptional repressor of mexJK operon